MTGQRLILVVDDEEIVCRSVKKILTREGCEVDMALTAELALQQLEDQDYDLVITDLMMPEMNGIELMHTIRKRDLDLPFLMITGYPTIRTAMQALRLGAVDYIPKPFTRQELMGPVNRALRRKDVRRADRESGAVEGEAVIAGDHFVLPEHSWATYGQDGTLAIGIERSFLTSAGEIKSLQTPGANEMIEQGHPIFKAETMDGDEHGVFSPLSGRVIAVNQEALDEPGQVTESDWIIRVIPSSLAAEVTMLVKKPS